MNRRRIWQSKRTIAFLLAMLLVGICLKIIFGSDFRVNTIYIEGDPEKNTDFSAFDKLNNIFLVSTEKISRAFLEKNPLTKSITITKKYPHSLYIKINYRQAKYYAYLYSEKILFDESGTVISFLSNPDQIKMTEINCNLEGKITDMKIGDGNLIKILNISESIKRIRDLSINYILCQDKDKYLIRINGIQFIFKPDIDPNIITGSLQVLFKQFKIEGKIPKVVDLRFSKPVLTYDDVNGDNTGTAATQ